MKSIVIKVLCEEYETLVYKVPDDNFEKAINIVEKQCRTFFKEEDGSGISDTWSLDSTITKCFKFPYERHDQVPTDPDFELDYDEFNSAKYVVEVGVIGNDETAYKVEFLNNGKKMKKYLYDEDVSGFSSLEEAVEYINEYLDEGVPGTYAMMWEWQYVEVFSGQKVIFFKIKE